MMELNLDGQGFENLARELLGNGRKLRFQARGNSMWPLIRSGDWLDVQPVPGESLRRGDILLCSPEPGKLVAHRLVKIQAGTAGKIYHTRGDAARRPGETLSARDVLGLVVAIRRQGRVIRADSLAWKLGRLLVYGVPRWILHKSSNLAG